MSGDTAPTDAVIEACDRCDVLVHEVSCKAGWDRGAPAWHDNHPAYHASSKNVVKTTRYASSSRGS